MMGGGKQHSSGVAVYGVFAWTYVAVARAACVACAAAAYVGSHRLYRRSVMAYLLAFALDGLP